MNKNWKLQNVAAITFVISLFFWVLILPDGSKGSVFLLVPMTIALVVGAFILNWGFVIYRKYRVLTGLPRALIRNMALGPVEIHGKAFGEQRVVSPVSRTLCLYYEVQITGSGRELDRSKSTGVGYSEIDQGGRSERDRDKSTGVGYYEIDQGGGPFYLQDETGSVRVEPAGLECDLRLQTRRRAAAKDLSSRCDQDLMVYAQSVIGRTGGDPRNLTTCTFDEYCVLPDRWYDLTGTCIENPNPDDAQARNAIVKGQEETTFLISWRSEAGIEEALRKKALLSTFGGGGLMIASFALILHELGLL